MRELSVRESSRPPAWHLGRNRHLRFRCLVGHGNCVRPRDARHRCAVYDGECVRRPIRRRRTEVVDELRDGPAAGETDALELARDRRSGLSAVVVEPAQRVPIAQIV